MMHPISLAHIHRADLATDMDGLAWASRPTTVVSAAARVTTTSQDIEMLTLARFRLGRVLLHLLAMLGDRCVRFHLSRASSGTWGAAARPSSYRKATGGMALACRGRAIEDDAGAGLGCALGGAPCLARVRNERGLNDAAPALRASRIRPGSTRSRRPKEGRRAPTAPARTRSRPLPERSL